MILTRPRADDRCHAGIGFDYWRQVVHVSDPVQHINSKRLSQKGSCVCSAGEVLGYFLRTESEKGVKLGG